MFAWFNADVLRSARPLRWFGGYARHLYSATRASFCRLPESSPAALRSRSESVECHQRLPPDNDNSSVVLRRHRGRTIILNDFASVISWRGK